MNEHTGAITVRAARPGGLTVADTSGLAAVLGFRTGEHAGGPRKSTTVETVTEVRKVTNTAEVATKVSGAIDGLIDNVGTLSALPDGAKGVGKDVRKALEEVVGSVRNIGVQGLSVTDEDGTLRLAVDKEELERSLETIGDRSRAASAVQDVLEGFAGRLADVVARQQQAARAEEEAVKERAARRQQQALSMSLRNAAGQRTEVDAAANAGGPQALPAQLAPAQWGMLRPPVQPAAQVHHEAPRDNAHPTRTKPTPVLTPLVDSFAASSAARRTPARGPSWGPLSKRRDRI
jgi:hypothetical protein